jgi:hypothetical protein
MFSLTAREQLLAVFVLLSFLLGPAIRHWWHHHEDPPLSAPAER